MYLQNYRVEGRRPAAPDYKKLILSLGFVISSVVSYILLSFSYGVEEGEGRGGGLPYKLSISSL